LVVITPLRASVIVLTWAPIVLAAMMVFALELVP